MQGIASAGLLELRDYQAKDVTEAWALACAGERPIVVEPTGGGKTYGIVGLIARARSEGLRVMVMTPRLEILVQLLNLTDKAGFNQSEVGVIMGSDTHGIYRHIQVVSWSTVNRRAAKSNAALPLADVVIIDEAHLSLSYKLKHRVLDHYKERGAKIIGFSATPSRKNGYGLGDFYPRIVQSVDTRTLIERGELAQPIYYGGDSADMAKVKVLAGDYNMKQASSRCRDPVLIGHEFDNWARLAGDRHTLVFACDIAHAHALAEKWVSQGVSAGVVTDKSTREERDETIAKFRNREIQVLVNVLIGCYGLDIPSIDCVVLARPTKSVPLHLQMLGRGLRADEGKKNCLILDHTTNVVRLGMAEETFPWTLDTSKKVTASERVTKRDKKDDPITCKKCGHLFRGVRECPMCGEPIPIPKRDVRHTDSTLKPITRKKREVPVDRKRVYLELRTLRLERGYKPGYERMAYKDRFGEWPSDSWDKLPMMPVSDATRRYVRHRNIQFAKSREKQRQREDRQGV